MKRIVFNDEVTLKTQWEQMATSTCNWKTHTLNKLDEKIEIRQSRTDRTFFLFFLVLGLVALIAFFFQFVSLLEGKKVPDKEMVYIWGACGIIFTSVGVFHVFYKLNKMVFDRKSGFYWSGRKAPDKNNFSKVKDHCSLEDIHALQILDYINTSADGDIHQYEINLVLKDGARKHLFGHGVGKTVDKDAEELATFLNVPCWNRSTQSTSTSFINNNLK